MVYQKTVVYLSVMALSLGGVVGLPAYAAPKEKVQEVAMPLQQTSQEVQKALLDAYAKINQQTDVVQIQEVSFVQTGLFSAKQVVKVRIGCATPAAAPAKKRGKSKKAAASKAAKVNELVLEHTIDYGPSALLSKGKLAKAVVQTRVQLSPAQRKDLEKNMGKAFANTPTQIETVLNLDNSLETLIEEKAFQTVTKDKKPSMIDFQGAKAQLKLNPDTMMGQAELWINSAMLAPVQKLGASSGQKQEHVRLGGLHVSVSRDALAGISVQAEAQPMSAFFDTPERKIKTYTGKGKRRKAQTETIPARRMDMEVGGGSLSFNLSPQNGMPTQINFKQNGWTHESNVSTFMHIKLLPVTYTYTAQAPDYFTGAGRLNWAGFQAFDQKDAQVPIVDMGALSWQTDSAENGLYLDNSGALKIAALKVKDMDMGPFTIKASVNHLLAEPFKALYRERPYGEMLNVMKPALQNVCSSNNAENPHDMLNEALLKLLAISQRYQQASVDAWKGIALGAPVLSYDQVELQFPEGKVNFTGKISTQNLQKLDLDRLDEKQPETWRGLVNSLVGNYQFTVDDALAYALAQKLGSSKEVVDDLLQGFVQDGWFVRANNQIQSVGTLAQSKWLSNGVDKSALVEQIFKPRPVIDEYTPEESYEGSDAPVASEAAAAE